MPMNEKQRAAFEEIMTTPLEDDVIHITLSKDNNLEAIHVEETEEAIIAKKRLVDSLIADLFG